MKTINNILQIKKRSFRVTESTWLRKGWRLAQVVGFFSALGLLWILVNSTSVQAFIYKAVVPEKSTFSIVAVDPLTGEVGIAGASSVPISAAGMTALVPGQGLIKTLKGFKMDYNKGPEEFRACGHIRATSVVIVRGIGAKASGMNYGEVVGEIPWQETLESCENNKNDVPYGKVKLPGK